MSAVLNAARGFPSDRYFFSIFSFCPLAIAVGRSMSIPCSSLPGIDRY